LPGGVALTSEQVRSHRILATGLARGSGSTDALPGWDLGVQDRDGSALIAVAARLDDRSSVPSIDDPAGTGRLLMLWSLRGSPHLHRRADAGGLAAALWPATDADAAARLSGDAGRLRADGADPQEAFRVVSDAMRSVITAPMTKGVASAAVTAVIPARFAGFCRPCGSVHVRELLFRLAALPAAVGLLPGTKPVVLAPLSKPFRAPRQHRGLGSFVAGYYRLYGTGRASDVGTHLGTSAAAIRASLPDDLMPVTVDGVRTQAPAGIVDLLRGVDVGAAASLVRLLPAGDPLLQPRDRAVLVSDRTAQQALWPTLGPPGAVLAGGGPAGIWRTRLHGPTLAVTISPWRRLTRTERAELELEAEIVRAVRRAAQVRLVIDG